MKMSICSWPMWNIKKKITFKVANLSQKFKLRKTQLN